ncbi:MAG: hypothetical protein ABWX84_12640 [Nocardioides sp.]
MRTRSFRRYAVAALSVAALAAVSGCGSDVHPGQAAVVEGQRISMSDADSFSDDFCELYRPILKQQDSALAMSTIRALALDVLVRDEVVHQYAEDRGWTPPASYHKAVRGIDQQAEQFQIPAADLDTFRKVREAEEYANWVYAKAGQEKVGETGDAQAALAEGRTILTAYADDADITLDPRFGTVSAEGQYLPSTGGLSVPVTTLAKGGSTPADPQSGDTSYVDSLPANQKCG